MQTKDPVNQYLIEQYQSMGMEELGLMSGSVWRDDPQRLLFMLARYKFVAKMLRGVESVAEIGCGDGFGARIVRQEVARLVITDYDPVFIEKFARLNHNHWDISAKVHDIFSSPLSQKYDAIYSLDVLEHIEPAKEDIVLRNIQDSLGEDGVAIIGMPSLESQVYASRESKEGHVNCKTGRELHECLGRFFRFVFIFSMNDEVVHTGYQAMAHYLIGLCCGPRT
jgi:2-polyprenyl-3-methyl-5-hydroxy-6-metoxy-1,4-benzoquinol methylase